MPAPIGSGAPPAFQNLANTCTVDGSSAITFNCNKGIVGVVCSVVLTEDATGNVLYSGAVPAGSNSSAFTITGTANGNYTLTADNGEATASVTLTVNCSGTSLVLTQQQVTQPTSTLETGSVVLRVNSPAGQPAPTAPVSINLAGVAGMPVTMSASANGYTYSAAGLNSGTYAGNVTDSADHTLAVRFTIEPAPVVGCTNPDADNYTPGENVTSTFSLCTFSPKLTLAAPPELGALGRPLFAQLQSAPVVWSTPSQATATLTLTALADGVSVSINGYRFTAGPPLTPTYFQDTETLAVALLGVPALAAILLASTTPTAVLLTARRSGPAGNITATSSNPGRLLAQTTAGQPTTHGERRVAWGCWLEVWAMPGLAYGGTDKTGAVLAYRFESRLREDNVYAFDIADCLRAYTGLSFACTDRVVGYFLRYGETYADAVGSYRRIRPAVGESNVLFGLEAVQIVPRDEFGARTLSRRPGPWRLPDGRTVYQAQLPAAGALVLTAYAGPTEPSQGADAATLHFVPGQGGLETVFFEGLQEAITKRTASLYSTPTGRALQQASIAPAGRLHSGLLSRAEWDWLRLELGSSPAVWLETQDGPQPVLLTALTAEADELKGEYAVLIEYEFCAQPALGLIN